MKKRKIADKLIIVVLSFTMLIGAAPISAMSEPEDIKTLADTLTDVTPYGYDSTAGLTSVTETGGGNGGYCLSEYTPRFRSESCEEPCTYCNEYDCDCHSECDYSYSSLQTTENGEKPCPYCYEYEYYCDCPAEYNAESNDPIITITFPEDADYYSMGMFFVDYGDENVDLLYGVTAVDENGERVDVFIVNYGGFDVHAEFPDSVFTVTYGAIHPETDETITRERTVVVVVGIMPLSSGGVVNEVTLRAAVSSGADGDVVLSNNIELDAELTIERSLTINLNGYTLRIDLPDTAAGGQASNGIKINPSVTLTIMDSSSNGGTLYVRNRSSGWTTFGNGAAINTTDGTLIIQSGTITATGGSSAAGIGGGREDAGGSITINGGTVTAQGGSGGAGVGGGTQGAGGSITIDGGTVTAQGGGSGAGIGGGNHSNGGTIRIYGGTVTAQGGSSSAGIGGGSLAAGGNITIDGGTVTAQGGSGGAGVGGGSGSWAAGGNITINGGFVTANGGSGGGMGIGRGSNVNAGPGTLTMNGTAIVFASDVSDTDTTRRTRGILFIGNSGHVYGDVTLERDLIIPGTHVLNVPFGARLVIPHSTILNNLGSIFLTGGEIIGVVTGNQPVVPDNRIDLSAPISSSGIGWSFANNVLAIHNGAHVYITSEGTATNRRIVIDDGATATITLRDVTIQGAGHNIPPFLLQNGANLRLYFEGTNTLTAGGNAAGIQAPGGTAITIIGASGATLTARGGGSSSPWGAGAGIGGGGRQSGGNITIRGEGNVIANGGTDGSAVGAGAGIGGGSEGAGGNITIGGTGRVTAIGGSAGVRGAAGIGGGSHSSNNVNGGAGGTIRLEDTVTIEARRGSRGAYNIGHGSNHGQPPFVINYQGAGVIIVQPPNRINIGTLPAPFVADTWEFDTSGVLTVFDGADITVYGTSGNRQIVVAGSVSTAKIALENASIAATGSVLATHTHHNVELALVGNNSLTTGGSVGINFANPSTLTISGDSNARLTVSGTRPANQSFTGIHVPQGGTLIIDGGNVSATSTGTVAGINVLQGGTLIINGGNVTAIAGTGATAARGIGVDEGGSVMVNGGIVIARSVAGGTPGIGGTQAAPDTGSLTINGDAVVIASSVRSAITHTRGILFNGSNGAMVGNVSIPGDVEFPTGTITIGAGQTLTIPSGVTLTNRSTITNYGTIRIEDGGTLNNLGTIINRGTINNSGELTGTPQIYSPAITSAAILPDGKVGAEFSHTLTFTGSQPTWNVSAGSLPSGLNLNQTTGVISGTPTTVVASHTFTVQATNPAGSDTRQFTITVARGDAPDVTWPTSTPITFGAMLSASPLTGGSTEYGSFEWAAPNTVPNVVNSGFYVTFTPNDNIRDNFEEVTPNQRSVAITVNRAAQPTPAISGGDLSRTYGETAPTLNATGGIGTGNWEWSSSDPAVATVLSTTDSVTVTLLSSGSTDITVRRLGDSNHNVSSWSAPITLTVNRASGSAIQNAATESNVTHNTITVNAATLATATEQSVEYAINQSHTTPPPNGPAWQLGLTFGGLNPNTEYFVWARSAQSNTHAAGAATASSGITTAMGIQAPPSGITHTNETIAGANDGTISGVSAQMEWRSAGSTNGWTDGTGQPITGLAPGTYHVRYAERTDYYASPHVTVQILAWTAPKPTPTPQPTPTPTPEPTPTPQPIQPDTTPTPDPTLPTPQPTPTPAPQPTPTPTPTPDPTPTPLEEREQMPADDLSSETILEAIRSDEPVLIVLREGASTEISADTLQLIKESGETVYVELPSGTTLRIDPAAITDNAVAVDLNIIILFAYNAAHVSIGGEYVLIPANTIIIKPPTHGGFGFDVSIIITAEQLEEAGLHGDVFRKYHIGEGNGTSEPNIVITEKGRPQSNSDGTVVITINHASVYLLRETPLLDAAADMDAEDITVATPETPPETDAPEPETGADASATATAEPRGGNALGWVIGVIAALVLSGGGLAIFLIRRRTAQ